MRDQPIPETMRDHANAHSDDDMEMDSDMPGMMSSDEMADLEAAEGAQFQQMWLEMMTEQSEGTFGPAVELAETIESAQHDEISTMESLLIS